MRGIRRGRKALSESKEGRRERREQLRQKIGAREAAILETKVELSPTIILDTAVGDTVRILEQLLPEGAEVTEEQRAAVNDLMKRQLFEAGKVAESKTELHARVLEGRDTIANLKTELARMDMDPADFALCALSPAYFHETMYPLANTDDEPRWPGQVFHVAISRGPLRADGTPAKYLSPTGVSFADQIEASGISKDTPVIIADENIGSGGTVMRVYDELVARGYKVEFAAAGFYSKVKGRKLKDTLPVIANVTRYESEHEKTVCQEAGLDIHPSTEIGDSTLSEGIRAGDGKKRTILAGTVCINSSFFRRLERIGAYDEYLLDALENERIKFIGLKKIAGVEEIPISTTLLVNDGYLMREIEPKNWDGSTDVITVIDYLIEKITERIETERAQEASKRKQYYEAVVLRDGEYSAVVSYDDIDGSTVPEIATDSEGYVQLRMDGDQIVGLLPVPETEKFSPANPDAGIGPEKAYVDMLAEYEIGLSKTSTRSIEECLYVMDQADRRPDFLGAEDGNVCWLRRKPSEQTLIALRKRGYVVQDLLDDGVVVHTRPIEFSSANNAETYPYCLDTIVGKLREKFGGGFVESNEAVEAYSAGNPELLAEANRILRHPAGDLEYTRRALTRYGSRLLMTESQDIKEEYQRLAKSYGLHTADYGPNNPVIATANNDKSLPLDVYSYILQQEHGLQGLVVESRLNSSNDVRFALKAASGEIENVEVRVHFMSAGKVRPDQVDAVREALGTRITILEHEGEHYLFKVNPEQHAALEAAGIEFVFGTPSIEAFTEIHRQVEEDIVPDIETPSHERLLKGVKRAEYGELVNALERMVHYEGIEAIEAMLPADLQAVLDNIELQLEKRGPEDTPHIMLDSDGTAPLVIDPRRPSSFRGPFHPGTVIVGEPPLDYVRDLKISPDQVDVWAQLAEHGVGVAILSGRSAEDLASTYAEALSTVPEFVAFPGKGRAMLLKEGLDINPEMARSLQGDPLGAVANRMVEEMIAMTVSSNKFPERLAQQLRDSWKRGMEGDGPAMKGFEEETGFRVKLHQIEGRTVLIRLHHLYRACELAAERAGTGIKGADDPKRVNRKQLSEWLQKTPEALARLQADIARITAAVHETIYGGDGQPLNMIASDEIGGRSFCQDFAPSVNLAELMQGFDVQLYAGDNPVVGGDDILAMRGLKDANADASIVAVHHGKEHDLSGTGLQAVQGTQFDLFLMQYALAKRLDAKSKHS